MKPIHFEQVNTIFSAPPGVPETECGQLPAYVHQDETSCFSLSCWQLTAKEMREINRTGRLWLFVSAPGQPPVSIQTRDPFKEEGTK